MIINIRVDHTLADIETMEKVSKDLKELFSTLKEQMDVKEYIENQLDLSVLDTSFSVTSSKRI